MELVMRRVIALIVVAALCGSFARHRIAQAAHAAPAPVVVDRDQDGLDDALELRLATTFLPTIHEFQDERERDACPEPTPRPIVFRVRPRVSDAGRDPLHVAITYVLLYSADCGALGHRGDNEAFTLALEERAGAWQRTAAVAVAHQATEAEVLSSGSGGDIWVSRDKHANFASFIACGEADVVMEECSEHGPRPASFCWLNAGEPWAPLSNDLGDFGGTVGRLFRGQRVWNHGAFFEAGDITTQLFLTRPLLARLTTLGWNEERPQGITKE
jgi:hypothetical protein